MSTIDDVGQKAKGKVQKVKGKLDQNRVRGTIEEIKGNVNESIADTKLKIRQEESKTH